MTNALRIGAADNVATALTDLPAGATVELAEADGQRLQTAEPIPFGHKVALRPIAAGETVLKYGASIGVATRAIAPGHHVHIHNLRSVRGAARS